MNLACALLLITAALPSHSSYAQSSQFTIELTAHLKQGNSLQWDFDNHSPSEIRAGDIVEVATRKTNTSNQEILKFPFSRMPYAWDVRDSSGHRVSLRIPVFPGGAITGGGPALLRGSKQMFLQPGESMTEAHLLKRFDMSQPGIYTIQATQHIGDSFNSPEIKSNIITITVLPAKTTFDLSDPKAIIQQLAPGEVAPEDLAVNPAQRARVIELLINAKHNETGWHRQLAIYLLICLHQNYNENIRDLLSILEDPGNHDTEDTLDLIIKIYRQGHPELMETILKTGPRSNAGMAQELGTFFEEDLKSHPKQFVSVLSGFSVSDQKSICRLAGRMDGGGLPPGDEAEISRKTRPINSSVARDCTRNVRKGNRLAQQANR